MQTVWSRVAQVRGGCRCPQCLPFANGVSRRATASATRRTPKYLTSSTLWYSGIFAAAATFDAGAKKQRREQWEQAIAGVEEELKQPGIASAEPSSRIAEEMPQGGSYVPSETNDIFRHVDSRKPKPRWPTNTGQALDVHFLAPESIYAAEERKERARKRQLTPKKLATLQLSLDMLQLKIFLELQNQGWSREAASCVPEDYAANFVQSRKELLRSLEQRKDSLRQIWKTDSMLSDFKLPESQHNLSNFTKDSELVRHTTEGLNSALQELFQLHRKRTITTPSLIAQLAYNLSVSLDPPNTNTYNTILLGLSRAEQPTLVEHTIRSIREAHVRPNEVTLAAILNHYSNTNNVSKFIRWVEIMRGKHNGLGLARSSIKITNAGRSRLVRKPEEPWKIIQLPYPTPGVFSALISGVVKFSGFDAALNICQSMGHEGWGLCMAGLTPLLQDCAARSDWSSGLAVWKQIQVLRIKSRRKQGVHWLSERISLHTFATMLRLCSNCKQRTMFDEIWSQAMGVHRDMDQKLVRLVKVQSDTQVAEGAHGGQYGRVRRANERPSGRTDGTMVAETEHFVNLSGLNSNKVEKTIQRHTISRPTPMEEQTKPTLVTLEQRRVPNQHLEANQAHRRRLLGDRHAAERFAKLPLRRTCANNYLPGLISAGHEIDDFERGELSTRI